MNTKRMWLTTVAFFSVLLVQGCGRQSSKSQNPTTPTWEYLVVSFGKTQFSEIEVEIESGRSKLGVLREFSDLIRGSESINAQEKLDLLGRFGWEVVDVLGAIGGDQQIVLKRIRRQDQIPAEQEILSSLSSSLKSEIDQRQKAIQAYLELLQKQNGEGDLVELDAKEKSERQQSAEISAVEKLKAAFPKENSNLLTNLLVVSVDVRAHSFEGHDSRMSTTAEITFRLDATEVLLTDNGYRASKATALAEQALEQMLKPVNVARYNVDRPNLEVTVEILISRDGKVRTVAVAANKALQFGF